VTRLQAYALVAAARAPAYQRRLIAACGRCDCAALLRLCSEKLTHCSPL